MHWFKKKSVHGWKKWSSNWKFCKKYKESLITIKFFEFSANHQAKIKTWSTEAARHGALTLINQIIRKYFWNWRSTNQLQWNGPIDFKLNWIFRYDYCIRRWC